MRRFTILSLALALLAFPAAAKNEAYESRAAGHEPDTYRFGATYTSVRGSSPLACEQACASDGQCKSWSLVPASLTRGPRCELKSGIGSKQSIPGAVSGISPAHQALYPGRDVSFEPQSVRSTATYTPAPSPVAQSQLLAGGSSAVQARPAPVQPRTISNQPTGDVAVSRFVPVPQQQTVTRTPPPQPARTVTRTVSSQPARDLRAEPPVPQVRPQPQPEPQRTVTRTVTREPSAPQTVTRRTTTTSRPATTDALRPETPPLLARPEPQPQPQTVTRRVEAPAPRPAPQTPPQSRPAQVPPQQVTRQPSQPAPRTANGYRERPAYSVQDMEVLPGDYDAMAGYVDGLPNDPNAEYEPTRDRTRPDEDEDDDEDDDDGYQGYSTLDDL